MSRHDDPFQDILQPQPRSAQHAAFQDDPFGDDDSPGLFAQSSNAYGGAVNGSYSGGEQVNGQSAGSSRDPGRQHGYTLDPFFDE
jgi:hypothetical protein